MMHKTVSHILVMSIVTKEYLLGLSLNSMMSLIIFIMAEKGMKEQNKITAANIIVDEDLF